MVVVVVVSGGGITQRNANNHVLAVPQLDQQPQGHL
jgi:hypothetical protein